MKPNAYGIFKIRDGELVRRDIKATLEEAEDSIKIPADTLGTVEYMVLPMYCSNPPKPEKKK